MADILPGRPAFSNAYQAGARELPQGGPMHQADRSDSSASAAVQVIDGLFSSPSKAHHAVQFYESEDFLCDVVARYLDGGLRAGEPAVLLITPERARGIFERLKKGEYDVEGGLATGQPTPFDPPTSLRTSTLAHLPHWGPLTS